MKEKSQHTKRTLSTDFSLLQWAAILGTMLFFFIFPYQYGLFNGTTTGMDENLYEAMMYVGLLMIIMAFYLLFKWRPDNVLAILSLFVLLLPLVYYLASISPATKHAAVLTAQVTLILALFFVAGLFLSGERLTNIVIRYGVTIACYSIVVFGLLNMFGQVYYPDGIWFTNNEYRLSSVFQYPNTYAGFLISVLLIALFGMTSTRERIPFLVHAAMAVPVLISMMLTFSRGGLIVLPFLLLLVLLCLRIADQIRFSIYLLIGGVSMLAVLGKITQIYLEISAIVQPKPPADPSLPPTPAQPMSVWDQLPLQGWGLLLAGVLIFGSVVYWLHFSILPKLDTRLAKLERLKFLSMYIPVAMLTVGIVAASLLMSSPALRSLLPVNIADRLANINFQQHSVLERMTFYRDALKVVQDFPLLGTGGNGWSAIYEQYQNNPYISKQAHSYIMQTLVEVGWVGMLLFAAFFVAVFTLYIKCMRHDRDSQARTFPFFLLAAAILVHSTIDFDMSYAYLGCLVFFSLGAMLAPYRDRLAVPALSSPGKPYIRFVYPAILLVLSVTLVTSGIRAYSGIQNFKESINIARQNPNSLNEALVPLDRALKADPRNPAYVLLKADWLTQVYHQTGDKSYLDRSTVLLDGLIEFEPYDNELILAKYRNLKDRGEYNHAVEMLEEGIRKFQWDINFYEAAILELSQEGLRLKETDAAAAAARRTRAIELYHEVLRRMELLKELPEEQMQGRNFTITRYIRSAVGIVYFEEKDYLHAVEILEPLQAEDFKDPIIRGGMRYYLASLDKLGQNNENVLNRLIAVDENEKMAVQELISVK